MNTAATASQIVTRTPEHRNAPAIRVIAGGTSCERRPLHARAESAPTPAGVPARAVRPFEGLQGTPYGLSTRERALAVAGGILFALAAFACLMV